MALVLFAVAFLRPSWLRGQEIQSLIVEFNRTTHRGSKEEIVKGTIYYQTPDLILVQVNDPLNQWMKFEGETLVIYYPDEQKGFRILSQYPFTLPFFQTFVGMVKEGFGLADIGYTLNRNETRGETLVTVWAPPEKTKNVLGNIIVGMVEDRIAFTEMLNAKGKKIARATYADCFSYNGHFFPLTVSSTQWLAKETTSEEISYREPQFDVELPEEVTGFQIPDSVAVKEVKW